MKTEKSYEELRAGWDAGFARAKANPKPSASFHERMAAAYRQVGRIDQAGVAEQMAEEARKR